MPIHHPKQYVYDAFTIKPYKAAYMYDRFVIDNKMAHILYNYLMCNSDFLPSFKLVETAISTSTVEDMISLGYGIDVSRDMIVTYKSITETGSTRSDVISPDGYEAFVGKKDKIIDFNRYPMFREDRIATVQNYLRRLRELYPVEEKKK